MSTTIRLDQYYTKPCVAAACYATFQRVAKREGYDLGRYWFVEPSAGTGSFSDLLPAGRFALDVEPRGQGIEACDFFHWIPPRAGRYAVVGNPPFGDNGRLALSFLRYSALFADLVGFVLPMGFSGVVPRVSGLHLHHSEPVPDHAFVNAGGKTENVPCVFQVWMRKAGARKARAPSCSSFCTIHSVRRYAVPSKTIPARENVLYLQKSFYPEQHAAITCTPAVPVSARTKMTRNANCIFVFREVGAIVKVLQGTDWRRYARRNSGSSFDITSDSIRRCITDAGFVDTPKEMSPC